MIWSPYFWVQAIALAFGQIWANKTRSFLTALGIIVGVASVTAVIAALTGLKAKVLTEFESFGANRIFLFPDRPQDKPRNLFPWELIRLKPEEVQALAEDCQSIRAITPITEMSLAIESDMKKLDGLSVTGIWSDWHEAENRRIIEGRPFNRIDEATERQVCIINESAIDELMLPEDPIGSTVLLGGRRFVIVGIVETLQARMFGSASQTAEIFVPFSIVAKLQSRDFWMRVAIVTNGAGATEEAQSEIKHIMRRLRGIKPGEQDTFRVEAIDRYIQQFKTLAAGITAIAGGIVGISLLVGGIGIMNIMLVSVSERTREIGLRKAVGATPAAILLQFLLEAVALCFAGGFVGVAVGKALAFGLTMIPKAQLDQASVPFWAVLMSFAFSAFVGVVFGMFPAIKAARLDPIEALRHE